MSAANASLSSLAEEAAAAKHGLRLLARACVPLIERCRVLAAQKRLLTKWHGPRSPASGGRGFVGAGAASGTSMMPVPRGTGGAAQATAPGLLLGGLRSLAGALGREAGGQPGRSNGEEAGSNCEDREGDAQTRSAGRSGVGDGETARDGDCVRRHQTRGKRQQRQRRQQQLEEEEDRKDEEQPPLVSLRAVGIAAVAAQRLVRLAACRAARRASTRAAAARRAASAAATAATPAEKTLAPTQASGTSDHRGPLRPGHDRASGDAGGGGFIPLGPWGSAGRGVALLDESELVPPMSVSPALSSVFYAGTYCTAAGARASAPKEAAGASDPATADADAGADAAGVAVGCGPGGGRSRDDSESAATRCLELLGALVANSSDEHCGRPAGAEGSQRRGGEGALRCYLQDVLAGPSLLQVVAGGQAGHRSRLEKRGLVVPAPWAAGRGCDPLAGGGASRVVAGRCAR